MNRWLLKVRFLTIHRSNLLIILRESLYHLVAAANLFSHLLQGHTLLNVFLADARPELLSIDLPDVHLPSFLVTYEKIVGADTHLRVMLLMYLECLFDRCHRPREVFLFRLQVLIRLPFFDETIQFLVEIRIVVLQRIFSCLSLSLQLLAHCFRF